MATETAALERRVRDMDERNVKLQATMSDAIAENEMLRQTVRAMQRGSVSRGSAASGLELGEAGASTAESRLAELREDFDELSQENWELLQENERAGAELAQLRDERGALDAAYSELVRHCESLQDKIENLEQVFTMGGEPALRGDSRPATGSDWGLGFAPTPRSANDAADLLLRKAGAILTD